MLFAMVAMATFAQERRDTTYVMFDFNLNPWGYPTSAGSERGWGPDFDDEAGLILEAKDFTWPIAEGSDKLITITVDVDLDEIRNDQVPVLCTRTCVNAGMEYQKADGTDSVMTMLFTYQGTTMRFKAPDGYRFGKMLFYNYHSPNFLVGDDYDEEIINKYTGTKDKIKFWTPDVPKVNAYGYNIWEGDATDILFNYPYFNAHFIKIDMRLVRDGEPTPEERADINGDGQVNALDIQAVINAAVVSSTEAKYDINGDGIVNALDIQGVINVAAATPKS